MKIQHILIIAIATTLFSCEKLLINPSENNPESIFEIFCKDYAEHYALFDVKNINWESVTELHRMKVHAGMSDQDLYDVLTSMQSTLNDGHVWLRPVNNPALLAYRSGYFEQDYIIDFDLNLIKSDYLSNVEELHNNAIAGMLPNNIGYLYLGSVGFSFNSIENIMNAALTKFVDTKGFILDIRNNPGGKDFVASYIAGRFYEGEETTYLKRRRKVGTGPHDFGEETEFTVKPEGENQYTNPVVVLTNRYTVSAAEFITLDMQKNENCTLLGDITNGSFANRITKELPNGWLYSISTADFRLPDGNSLEGIGIMPDILVQNVDTDLINGKDEVIETAMDLVK